LPATLISDGSSRRRVDRLDRVQDRPPVARTTVDGMEVGPVVWAGTSLHAQLSDAVLQPDGPPEDRHWGERTFFMSVLDGNTIELAAG